MILRWHLQLGNVVIPKSVTPARIRENFDLFDFELSEDDLAAIARLDAGHRTGPDPEHLRRSVGRTRSRRGPSWSAARSSRSAPRWPRPTSAGRAWPRSSTWSAASSSPPAATPRCCWRSTPRTGAATAAGRASPGAGGRENRANFDYLRRGRPLRRHPGLRHQPGRLAARRPDPDPGGPPGLEPGHHRLRPLPHLRPPGDGRHLRLLVAPAGAARTSAGGSSSSTSSARSSSWSPPSPPSSAPTAT